jgi:glycosyltransferase involved in cell wall biosynthesis
MRVLVLHNRYRAEGGEERAVADSIDLLRRHGHEVEPLERSSTEIGGARAARALIRGGEDPDEVRARVEAFRPDVVHAHNIHPRFGWRALAAAQAAGARTVLHVHNFRLFCAIGIAYRDGAPCHRCRGRDTLPGLRLRCRGNLPEAAAYAAGLHLQQPRLFAHTDRFVVLSEAHGAQLHALGLPTERSTTLPNFVPASRLAPMSNAGEGQYALIAGRLVEEKGFDLAIEAARRAGVPLRVAGTGPDEPRLRRLAAGGDVEFTGWLESEELTRLRAGAAVVLVPSRCEEACPYSALDALAAGVPVLGSDRGGVPEVAGQEGTLPVDDADAWAGALTTLWADRAELDARGARALERAKERFGEAAYLDRLLQIYTGH